MNLPSTPRWDNLPFHSLNWELKARFGRKLCKLSLDGGMTCPNRDGTLGTGAVSSAAQAAPVTSPPPARKTCSFKLNRRRPW